MKTYTIATIGKVCPECHAWYARMQAGIMKFEQQTGHHTSIIGPLEADEHLQETLIEDAIAKGVDTICVVPILPQSLEFSLSKARRHGIVVISHEADNLRNTDYDLEAFDNFAFGAHLMDMLAAAMQNIGEYAIFLGSLTAQSHDEWVKSALVCQQERYPNMRLTTRKIEDHDNQTVAYAKTKELLATCPNLKGILASGMTATVGIAQAIEEHRVQNKVAVVGTSLVSACRQCLRSGALNALCFWDPADTGYLMNKLAVMILEGQPITNGMDLGLSGYRDIKMRGKVLYGSAWIDVTKENMAEYNF